MLERTSKAVLYLVVLLFVILGSTIALDTRTYFQQRLMIYLALFTLTFSITGFIRSVQEAELKSMGIDALTIFVLLAVSCMTVTAVVGKILVEEFPWSTLDMVSDMIGIIFVALFLYVVPVYETQSGKTGLTEYLPCWPFWIFGPLFTGLVSAYLLRRRRRRLLEDLI